jgi:adenylate kinase family enzyme
MICDKCGGQLYQRSDDTAEVIRERIQVYERQTQPILQYYKERNVPFAEFKCEKLDMPPEIAVEEIMKTLGKTNLN